MVNDILDLWRSNEVVHLGKEAYRTFCGNYRTKEEALKDTGSNNETYRICLSGEWKFKYCANVNDDMDGFYSSDYKDDSWDTIPVPGCWQLHGHGIPIYTNTIYPFNEKSETLCPPSIPDEKNSKGLYRTRFVLPESFENQQVILNFQGVESAFYVWVNGKMVGFSQNTFSPAEFNITDYLRSGENTLALAVYRYCACSYVEDQDMWRISGIIRDVYLIAEPYVRIYDFQVKTILDADYKDAELNVLVKIMNNTDQPAAHYTVEMDLFDDMGNSVQNSPLISGFTGMENPDWPVYTWRKEDMSFARYKAFLEHPKFIYANTIRSVYLNAQVRNPLKWTAETPNLYTLILTLKDESGATVQVVKKRIGFRSITADKGIICVNGKPIKFKGVNLHEFHPQSGRVIDREWMIQDILLMKKHNINAVRNSHYPHHPIWYELCDEYGLYLMDECNLESHEISYKDDVLPGNDLRWTNCCIDRVSSMVAVNKNSPSVVVWSMSNEAGYGENLAIMAAYARTIDGTRLIHERQMSSIADMISDTYSSIEWLEKQVNLRPEFPFILNEYAHAMGNAMGNFEDYWQLFEKYSNIAGGFIWEWCDHGLWVQDEKGQYYYAYGGDFGDKPNSGNFVIDGVVTPERDITPKLLEVKRVQQFIKAKILDLEKGVIEIQNGYYHVNSDFLYADWTVERNGSVAYKGKINDLNITCQEKKIVQLDFLPDLYHDAGEYFFNISFCLKDKTKWAEKDYCVAAIQVPLKTVPMQLTERSRSGGILNLDETECGFDLNSEVMSCSFSKETGEIKKLEFNGISVFDTENGIECGPHFNAFRAFTDNDAHSSTVLSDEFGWEKIGLNNLVRIVKELHIIEQDELHVVIASNILHKCNNGAGFNQYSVYTVYNNGMIQMKNKIQPFGALDILPRIGFTLICNKNLENITWFGRGSHESYSDRKASADISLYRTRLEDEKMYYVMPQEMGNHEDTRWFAAASESGDGLFISGEKEFCFSAKHYLDNDLHKATHREFLTPREEVVLSVDYKQNGLGNASCGSDAMQKYKLYPETINFNIQMMPYSKAEDPFILTAIPINGPEAEDVFSVDASLSIDCKQFADQLDFIDPSDKAARKKAGYNL